VRLVIARCTVDYSGRLDAHLPEAVRLIMVKADGCVAIHADGGAYKPLNWMNAPNRLVCEPDLWRVTNDRGERLEIRLAEVISDTAHDMGIDPGLERAGVDLARELNRRFPGLASAVKWPNDLMRGDDKLGGILTEASGELVVVGWGANLHWPDPPVGRGAVYRGDPGPDAAHGIAARWAHELLDMMADDPDGWPRDHYRHRCSTIGRVVTWNPNGRGRAVDISKEGGLVVATPSGRITLVSGAVSEVRCPN